MGFTFHCVLELSKMCKKKKLANSFIFSTRTTKIFFSKFKKNEELGTSQNCTFFSEIDIASALCLVQGVNNGLEKFFKRAIVTTDCFWWNLVFFLADFMVEKRIYNHQKWSHSRFFYVHYPSWTHCTRYISIWKNNIRLT